MSVKMKVWTVLDIALRVPPIFLLDKALKYEFRTKGDDQQIDVTSYRLRNASEYYYVWPWITLNLLEDYGFAILEILLYIQVLFLAVCIFLFNTKQLLSIYIRLASVGIIMISFEINTDFLNYNENKHNYSLIRHTISVAQTYFIQIILALLFSVTNSINVQRQGLILLFIAPTFSNTLLLPKEIQMIMPALTTTGCTILLAYSMWIHGLRVCEIVYRGITWCHSVVENYGLYTMIETHWINLHIPQVFQSFWLIRMMEYSVYAINTEFKSYTLKNLLQGMTIHGSENIIALLGMASIVSLLCQWFGYAIHKFLQVEPSEKNVGNISAILFLLLSIQNGVTSSTAEERCYKINRNLTLLYTALLHLIYNIVSPILVSLSTSRNPNLNKHIRALTVTLLIFISPIIILLCHWQNALANAWLLAMTSLMVELIIKTTVLIIVYVLFTVDTYKDGLWENLDDYVYYLKAASSLAEFIIGIYLLINGVWVLIFESTGAIRACMMSLHAYFNIWIRGKEGWELFLLRRSAQKKINILQEATKEQLKKINDVCAICFQNLKTARITKCKHFFHGACLRKWLNVQDICPLCHTTLYNSFEERKSDWINTELL